MSSPSKHGPPTQLMFHCQNETNKAVRYGNIIIFCSFSVDAITEAKGGARAVEVI